MEFTNIRVDVLAMYFQVIKVAPASMHLNLHGVAESTRLTIFLCTYERLILLNLFYQN